MGRTKFNYDVLTIILSRVKNNTLHKLCQANSNIFKLCLHDNYFWKLYIKRNYKLECYEGKTCLESLIFNYNINKYIPDRLNAEKLNSSFYTNENNEKSIRLFNEVNIMLEVAEKSLTFNVPELVDKYLKLALSKLSDINDTDYSHPAYQDYMIITHEMFDKALNNHNYGLFKSVIDNIQELPYQAFEDTIKDAIRTDDLKYVDYIFKLLKNMNIEIYIKESHGNHEDEFFKLFNLIKEMYNLRKYYIYENIVDILLADLYYPELTNKIKEDLINELLEKRDFKYLNPLTKYEVFNIKMLL